MLFRAKLDTEFFAMPPDLAHVFHPTELVQHPECTYSIESLSTLKLLLDEMRTKKEDPILRFIVDKSGNAWFARENRPGVKTPKHFQMTGEPHSNACCITAGNIKFNNSTFSVLQSINHRSGDFHPSFYSLRAFLAILILNEELLPFKLPKVLIVKELNCNGDTAYKHKWPVSQMKDWIKTFSDNEELMKQLKQHDVSAKTVHYAATAPELAEHVGSWHEFYEEVN